MKTMGGKGKTRTCQQNLLCIVQLYARVIDKLTWKDASPSGPPRQRPGPVLSISRACPTTVLTTFSPSPLYNAIPTFHLVSIRRSHSRTSKKRQCPLSINGLPDIQGNVAPRVVLPDNVEMRSISLCSTSCIVRICSAVHQLSIIGRRDTVPTGLGVVGDERNCGNNY